MYIRTLNSCSILVELGVETMCELLWYASFCIYAIMIPTRRAGYTQSGKNEWWTKTYKSFLTFEKKNEQKIKCTRAYRPTMPIQPHTNTRP